MKRAEKPFFVGYLPVPQSLKLFLTTLSAGLIGVAAVLGLWIGTT